MNLPNKLTMLRMIMIPIFLACFYLPWDCKMLIAAIIFVLAYLTDALDGNIARKYNLVTDFGKFMDPIADKLLTAAAIVFMLANDMFFKNVGEAFVFITIAREFIVSGLRLVAASKGTVIAADKLGKIKTVMQFVTITTVLTDSYFWGSEVVYATPKFWIDNVLIGVTLILTVVSMINYLSKNREAFSQMK